ncbi:MAG: DUF432 domain-containing protein [Spirochaetales bacterium]|nr:DUF432 domain-containing protein [Spirochaetales bacterium]
MKPASSGQLTPSLLKSLWDPTDMKPRRPLYACLGPLELWVRQAGEDWFVAHRRHEPEIAASAPRLLQPNARLEELPWNRWVSSHPSDCVRLVPALPDRSVVVRPRFPLKVPTGESVLFYVTIPVWVRVTVGRDADLVLSEIPSVVLSNTWFGEPTSGELCYALKTRALRDLEELSNHPYMATCPVRIENQAPTDLDFQRICIRVEHLHVYRGTRRLWTNQVEVIFKGEDFTSQINVVKYAPKLEGTSERLCAAREPVERSLLKKSFYFLRSLTGF